MEMTKAELLTGIEREWQQFNGYLNTLSAELMTSVPNADGWTVKDHIAHVSAWHGTVIAYLEGRRGYEGMGISEAVYESQDTDAINAAVYDAKKDIPLRAILNELQATYDTLMELLKPMTEADIHQPARRYMGEDEENLPEVIDIVWWNTGEHYAEHQQWIREQLAGSLPR